MATSERELIMANIKTTLAAITTGGGYNFTVGQCGRALKMFTNIPEDGFPALFVAGSDQEIVNQTNTHFRAKLKTVIIGYVRTADAADEEQLETDLNALIQDTMKALLVDPTRGGNSIYTQIESDHTDKGAWAPYAGFEMHVMTEYRAAFAAP